VKSVKSVVEVFLVAALPLWENEVFSCHQTLDIAVFTIIFVSTGQNRVKNSPKGSRMAWTLALPGAKKGAK
jgi:hypothetical protein